MAFIPYFADHPRDHILRVSTVNPEALLAHLAFYRALHLAPGPLSRVRREMIAVAVSQLNECHY